MILVLVLLLATPFLMAMFTIKRGPHWTFRTHVGPASFVYWVGDEILAEDPHDGEIKTCRILSLYDGMATVEPLE